ncbi:ATR-interacting protein isoform X1 [Carcharodon carcharias]|uniref:ATR-interacting protein isoform X1 n=1 Tax=Carcharodon carcharias TaxID=13397 RepID=UPI001B7E5014|nr:ATR-interacting protein isoform X1 [Carcharodon carcharias]
MVDSGSNAGTMSSNALFMNSAKKRNSSVIYSVERLPPEKPVSSFSGFSNRGKKNINHDCEGFPPNKRHKAEQDTRTNEDPFGDNEDFTADDLEELDILASQVLSQDVKPVSNAMKASVSNFNNSESSVLKNDTNTKLAALSTGSLSNVNAVKELHGNGLIQSNNTDSFGFEVLQEQHEKLRQQFNELQEELQVKNGEIRVLRDSLRHVESEFDQQKRQYLLSEKEKTEAQGQREKELSKKVQSLQSELQFKEAEMNEFRTKLKNCERMAKSATLSVAKISPRKISSASIKPESSASPQIAKNYFPDKKTFAAEMSAVHSVCFAPAADQLLADKEDTRDLKELHIARREMPKQSPSLNSIQGKFSHNRQSEGSVVPHSICTGERRQITWSKADLQMATRNCRGTVEGAVLMTILLSQPVGPGTLGLNHLLNSNSETFSGLAHQHSCLNIGSSSTGESSEVGIKGSLSSLSDLQHLAMCGINMLILEQESSEKDLDTTKISLQLRSQNDLPGAVHLLPLIEYYLGIYCQALQTEKAGRSPSGSRNCCPSSSGESTASNVDDCFNNLEDFALAALSVLYHLISYSQKVRKSLLAPTSNRSIEDGTVFTRQLRNKNETLTRHENEVEAEPSELQKEHVKLQELVVLEQPQHHLFNKLLQLSDPMVISISHRRENLQNQSLKVLGKVAESATADLYRFHQLLSSQVLLRCLSPDSSCSIVQLVVQLLANLTDHVELASKFCSQSASCLFLNLYTYTSSRPDSTAADRVWLQLEQEVVRFLTKFGLSHSGASAVLVESDCPCNTEVLKTLVVMLHRQWLTVRISQQNLPSPNNEAVVQFLRETVLLLYSLSQRDKNFTDHCLDVLHLYDQVMHGIKAIFKKIPDLEESEELALEELCSHEPDVEYQELETDGP